MALALLDSSEGFDATGITAGGLLIASGATALIDGSGSWFWATVVVLLVGGWIPLAERDSLPTPLISFAFAGIGAYAGAWSARLRK